MNSWELVLMGQRVSRATGKMLWVQQSELYLFFESSSQPVAVGCPQLACSEHVEPLS